MNRKFAVFDIDGTIFRSHLYWEMALALARSDKLHPKLNKRVLELYDEWKRRTHKESSFKRFDVESVESINELIAEINPLHYDELLQQTIEPLLDHTYLYTLGLKNRLQAEGYFTIAISGSREEEVELFARHHKFDDWIGQRILRTDDKKQYTGERIITHKNKGDILRSFVDKHHLSYDDSYGVGDTSGDIELLEAVEHPIAFNPNEELLAYAKKQGWKIVIERKSVAFQLEYKDGQHVLV